jgi:hypothetical protein
MNPRLAVALPVLPALAHAATVRWAAADIESRDSVGGWMDVTEGMRSVSVWLAGFAVLLALVALLKPGLARLVGTFLLFASLLVQALWITTLTLVFVEDLTDSSSLGEATPAISVIQLATALTFLAASIVAVVALRRSRAGRSGGTAGRAGRAPTSSTGPAAA